jgi:acyl carrier protein
MTLRDRLAAAMADALGIDEADALSLVRDDAGPWDSVGHIQVILAAEDELGLPLLEEDLPAIRSLDDLLAAAQRAGAPD